MESLQIAIKVICRSSLKDFVPFCDSNAIIMITEKENNAVCDLPHKRHYITLCSRHDEYYFSTVPYNKTEINI